MSDALSFAEVDGQCVELLPARTVLSLFTAGPVDSSTPTNGAAGGGAAAPAAAPAAVPATYAGDGGDGSGKAAFFNPVFYVEGDVTNALTGGAGGAGGAVGGGAAPAGGAAAGG
jgi:hypothetical protein